VGASLGKEPIHQIIRICAGETTFGHVMMWVLIIVLIGVVFHGPHDRGLSMQPSVTRGTAALDCMHGTGNPVNFTVLKPSDWTWGKVINIKIDK
jgi:hypothetical protein